MGRNGENHVAIGFVLPGCFDNSSNIWIRWDRFGVGGNRENPVLYRHRHLRSTANCGTHGGQQYLVAALCCGARLLFAYDRPDRA
jgi:hypothetical protein